MQEAYNDMKASDEGVEKLIELEVAFLNVRSCPMSRVSVCFTLFPQGTRDARRNANAEEQGAGSGNTSLQSPANPRFSSLSARALAVLRFQEKSGVNSIFTGPDAAKSAN